MKKRVLSLTLAMVMALTMAIPAQAANPVKVYEHKDGTGQVIAEFSDVTSTTVDEETYYEPITVYHLPANATVTFHIPGGSDWWSLFRCNGMWVEQYDSGLKNGVAYTCDALNAVAAQMQMGEEPYEPTNEFMCEIMPIWEMTDGELLFKLVFDGVPTEKPAETPKPAETESDFEIENGVLKKYKGPGGIVTIPDSVTSIGSYAFNLSNLVSVTIPDSVTSIEYYAFSGCRSLTSVTMPASVTNIRQGAFQDCISLTSVTIPNRVTSIEKGVFQGCYNLTSVTIPSSVTSIGDMAFRGCTGLTSVTIPSSVTSIGFDAFIDCTGLTSVTIQNSVTRIWIEAFYGCTSLTDVYYSGSETQWKDMEIKERNDSLTSATIHYNSPILEPTEPEKLADPEPTPATYTANPTNDTLKVDGKPQVPTAYKIGDSNYFQLRDVAMMLNGTKAQFSVDYDAERQAVVIVTGEAYTPQGWELGGAAQNSTEAILGNNDIYINGEKADFAVYKIDGANFFQIRALGQALGFNVGWTKADGMFIESDKPYDPAN